MAVRTKNPFVEFARFVLAYLVVAAAVTATVAWIADPIVDAGYLWRWKIAFTLFGCIWLFKAGIDTLAEFRDEQAK